MSKSFTLLSLATAAALASFNALAVDVASDVKYGNIHGTLDITGATFTAVSGGSFSGNTAVVTPGANLSLSFNAAIDYTNRDYCAGCIIQEYMAWDGAAQAAGATPTQLNLYSGMILPDRALDTQTRTTQAPTTPGEYFIGGASTLQFNYVPVSGGLGLGDKASFKVTVAAVPEPESVALMLAGMLTLAFVAERKNRQRRI